LPGLGNIQILRVPGNAAVRDLIRQYQASGLVAYAEPDFRVRLDGVFPSDPSFLDGTLWGLNNAGQNSGKANADIDAPEAWSARTSASNVIVAIVDTGVCYTHEDLAENMWTSPHDGSHGIDVLAGSNDPLDHNGHGTRLAGVIGAVGNNGLGVVGVAWRVQLMACKFVDASGAGSVSDALVCLEYARTNGARIVNASWGLDDPSLSLFNALFSLREEGILVVAAAGNDARDIDLIPHYPAAFDLDNIVSVAAATRQDDLYILSSYGRTNVDLAAPGDEIYSTDSQSTNAYANGQGTSLATAYVTGAAALLRAAHPEETPAQIAARLLAATDALPALAGRCVSGGRLNLRKALGVPVSAPLLTSAMPAPGEPFVLCVTADPGRACVVEVSTNLLDWSPLSTNVTGLTGSFSLTNNTPGNPRGEFFRAWLAP